MFACSNSTRRKLFILCVGATVEKQCKRSAGIVNAVFLSYEFEVGSVFISPHFSLPYVRIVRRAGPTYLPNGSHACSCASKGTTGPKLRCRLSPNGSHACTGSRSHLVSTHSALHTKSTKGGQAQPWPTYFTKWIACLHRIKVSSSNLVSTHCKPLRYPSQSRVARFNK